MRKFDLTKDYVEKLKEEFYKNWDDSMSMDYPTEIDDYKERFDQAWEEHLETYKEKFLPKRSDRFSAGYKKNLTK